MRKNGSVVVRDSRDACAGSRRAVAPAPAPRRRRRCRGRLRRAPCRLRRASRPRGSGRHWERSRARRSRTSKASSSGKAGPAVALMRIPDRHPALPPTEVGFTQRSVRRVAVLAGRGSRGRGYTRWKAGAICAPASSKVTASWLHAPASGTRRRSHRRCRSVALTPPRRRRRFHHRQCWRSTRRTVQRTIRRARFRSQQLLLESKRAAYQRVLGAPTALRCQLSARPAA